MQQAYRKLLGTSIQFFILNEIVDKGLLDKCAQKIMLFESMTFSQECKRFQLLKGGYGVNNVVELRYECLKAKTWPEGDGEGDISLIFTGN